MLLHTPVNGGGGQAGMGKLGLGRSTAAHFIREIVVVVIGVLIALYAGNLAEAWNWQYKVDKGERQLVSSGTAGRAA